MRRFLWLLMLCALPAFAQTTTTYTGTIKDLTGATVTSGRITFTLGQGVGVGTIPGTGAFTATTVSCLINSSGAPVSSVDGVSPCVVENNTSLTPSGTFYKICIQPYNATPGACLNAFAIGGTVDLSTLIPTPATQPNFGPGIPGPTGPAGPPGCIVGSTCTNVLPLTGGTLTGPLTGTTITAPDLFSTGMGTVYLASAPYYASCVAATTTTSGTVVASVTIPVANASTYSANQGIFIAGAGVSGANFVGTVASVSGNTITLTSATSTSVTNALVQHDETVALNTAIAAIAAGTVGARIQLPPGTCNFNGPLQQTSLANAIIPMPNIPATVTGWGPGITIEIDGTDVPYVDYPLVTASTLFPHQKGTIIQTQGTSGNLIGAQNTSFGSWGPFTAIKLVLDRLTFRSPQNPGITMVNAGWIDELSIGDVTFDVFQGITGSLTGLPAQPTNTNGVALVTPAYDNQASIYIKHMQATGYYTCIDAGEHLYINEAEFNNCWQAMNVTSGGHAVHGNRILMQGDAYGITASLASTIVIENLDVEFDNMSGWLAGVPNGSVIYDPNNYLSGSVSYTVPHNPFYYGTYTQYGGANLSVVNLANLEPPAAPAEFFTGDSNLGSNWKVVIGGIKVTSETASGAVALTQNTAIWNAGNFGANQCSSVTIDTPGADGGGPIVMAAGTNQGSATGISGYFLQGTTAGTYLYLYNGGTVTSPTAVRLPSSSAAGPPVAANSILTLCHASNGVLTSYLNAAPITALNATDTTLTAGQPGISIYDTTGTSLVNFFTSAPIPSIYTANGDIVLSPHIVEGAVTLASGAATVTLTGNAAFSSSTTYACSLAQYSGTGGDAIKIDEVSGSSFTLAGVGTDAFYYTCVGN